MATAAVAPHRAGLRRRDEVFLSVFPKTNFTIPTPVATPSIGTVASPGQPFGGFNVSGSSEDETVKFNRAWSTATRFLTLGPGLEGKPINVDRDITGAFSFLLETASIQGKLSAWYEDQFRNHFRAFVLPSLEDLDKPVEGSEGVRVLNDAIKLLEKSRRYYYHALDLLIHGAETAIKAYLLGGLRTFMDQLDSSLHNIIRQSLDQSRIQKLLATVMFQHLVDALERRANVEKCSKDTKCHCKIDLDDALFKQLRKVGLGASLGQRAFALAVNRFLQRAAIERRCFEVDWSNRLSVVDKLRTWVLESVAPVIDKALSALTETSHTALTQKDAQQYVSVAVRNLAHLRTHSIFDYIKSWPDSMGAILDIREFINDGDSPTDKADVCNAFSEQIQKRLLHAGATTSDILSIYINVIHAFKTLDSRGVLLEKVALPIRHYLKARDDTVSVIAASFLADFGEGGIVTATDVDKICPDITVEVANSTIESTGDNRSLSWDDMDWMPDPIDAGPDYKASKSEDVLAYIIGLFDQEEFIKEVTTLLAQHLLHATDSEYVKETRLIELFKSRLDASKLQAAEVMLKDVRDSVSLGKRINPEPDLTVAPTPREIQAAIPAEGITLASLYRDFEHRMKRTQFIAVLKLVATKRNDLFYPRRTRLPQEPSGSSTNQNKDRQPAFSAQILSSFFWPQLRSNEFDMPTSLEPLKDKFENNFDMLGSQRKLQFRPALARVTIRLDLEDRVVREEDVPGWRASVIDAFATEYANTDQEPFVEYDDSVGLTASQLQEALSMEEDLVNDALTFWMNIDVLYQRSPGVYAVLERLDMKPADAIDQAQQAPQQTDAGISAVKSQDAVLKENAAMFETFIANMLKNQGPKPVDGMMGITALLKMVLPAFAYGEDEVRWLLGEMEARGEVARKGDTWAVAG